MTICRAIQAATQAVLDAILEPALYIYNKESAAWEAFKRCGLLGGCYTYE